MTKIVLVTGATDGIGRETALELARKGFRVIVHGRSEERLEATRRWLVERVAGAEVEVAKADLSVLGEVRALAADIARRFDRLDVLLNNAGIYANDARLTVDGWESTWGVNHVAPFVLTTALLPLLKATQATTGDARVINVSSVAHGRGRIEPATWRSLDGFEPYRAYANSKLANVLFANALQQREPTLAVTSLHPGVVSTKLLTEGFGMRGPDSVADGAATSVWLASDAEAGKLRGAYCAKARVAASSAVSRDPVLAAKLWELTSAGLSA